MKIAMAFIALFVCTTEVVAQQPQTQEQHVLQDAVKTKALGVLQRQRDQAINDLVDAQALLAVIVEQNDALRAHIVELENELKIARESAKKEGGP